MSNHATETHERAFSQVVEALSKDVPLLLHGSGDVTPSQVNPETVRLVSCLTVQFIEKLVDASLDAHFTFLNNPETFRIPPPSFTKHRMPNKPPPFSITHEHIFKDFAGVKDETDGNDDEDFIRKKRPQKRLREEYWDDELPQPKIRQQPGKEGQNSITTKPPNATIDQQPAKVPMEEWVGVVGVDFRETSIRKAHVKNAISTPSFVFPICHDTYAYNRVREIQAAKRTLDPLLQDSTINEMILTEGRVRKFFDEKKKEDDPEEEDDRLDENGGPRWPGLEYILPVNLLKEP